MCTSDPDPILMTDSRCQCDAAVQFYLQDDPAATAANAFQRYSAQVAAAIADTSQSAPTWHCEACPNTVHPRANVYKKIPANCTCIAAREAFVNAYPFVGSQDYDPVGFNEVYGALANTHWVDCSLCNDNPVFIEQYEDCAAAAAYYKTDTRGWWGVYFEDSWLAFWNSFLVAANPAWNYQLCDTGYGFDIVQDDRNCLTQRLNVIYTESARAIYVQSDPFAWGLTNGYAFDASVCTSDPDPIYMYDDRCQCDAAKALYVKDNPSATMANAYSTWVQQVNEKNINSPAPSWHCEACTGTVKKTAWQLNVIPQGCTCLAARDKFLLDNPEVLAADWDPVYYVEKLAGGSVSWDCTPCNTNPVYIDDPVSSTCAPALAQYNNEVWFAKYFADTFLAYWTAVMTTGRPIYHYGHCTGTAPTNAPSLLQSPSVPAAPTIPCQITRQSAADIALNGFQLMGDPLYRCGLQSVINTSVYLFNPFSNVTNDHVPYWQFAEWWSKEYVSPSSGAWTRDGSYQWSNLYKSLTIHPNGSLTMAMNSIAEYDGGWRDQTSTTWDAFLLSQPVSGPGGAFSDPTNTIATMTKLYFSIRVKLLYNIINPEPGYMPTMHAAQTPLYFVIQNLNPASPGYGQLVWLGVPLYDNRYVYPFGTYFVDAGTGSLIYGIGYGNFTSVSTHTGEWVTLQADLLPHAIRGIQIAYQEGLFYSNNLNDYQVGGMNVGFEEPGSFLSAMTWEALSLRYFSQSYPEPTVAPAVSTNTPAATSAATPPPTTAPHYICNATYTIYTQPPGWPSGLSAALSISVATSVLTVNGNPGWNIKFTAKGAGATAPFQITSSSNTGGITSTTSTNGDVTYTVTNTVSNTQSPQYLGWNAATSLASPHNNICGISINGHACNAFGDASVSC